MKKTKRNAIIPISIWLLIWILGFIFGGCGNSYDNPANDPPGIIQLSSGLDYRDPDFLLCEHQTITFNIIQYQLDHGMDASQASADALQTAIEGWNDLTGVTLFELIKVYTVYQPGQNVGRDIGIGITDLPNGILGKALPSSNCTCAIFINPLAASNWKIYAHELGHCLGFKHTGGIDTEAEYQTYLDKLGANTSELEDSLMFFKPKNGNFTEEMINLIQSAPIH